VGDINKKETRVYETSAGTLKGQTPLYLPMLFEMYISNGFWNQLTVCPSNCCIRPRGFWTRWL